jgi:hypothetical protein
MPSLAKRSRPTVPARPLFSRRPDRPGVYRSLTPAADRWVYYALGFECEMLGIRRPEGDETDEDVIRALRELMRDHVSPPALALIAGGGPSADPLRRPLFASELPQYARLLRPLFERLPSRH